MTAEEIQNKVRARDREVLRRLCEAKPYAEIAAELKCSVNDVKHSVRRIARKLKIPPRGFVLRVRIVYLVNQMRNVQ